MLLRAELESYGFRQFEDTPDGFLAHEAAALSSGFRRRGFFSLVAASSSALSPWGVGASRASRDTGPVAPAASPRTGEEAGMNWADDRLHLCNRKNRFSPETWL